MTSHLAVMLGIFVAVPLVAVLLCLGLEKASPEHHADSGRPFPGGRPTSGGG